jgi:hypothetical protein
MSSKSFNVQWLRKQSVIIAEQGPDLQDSNQREGHQREGHQQEETQQEEKQQWQ